MLEQLLTQEFIVNSASASIIIILGLISGRYVAQLSGWLLHKLSGNKKIASTFEASVKTFSRYAVYGFSIIIALNRLGIASTVFSLASLIILLIAILATFILLRDAISNIISSIGIPNKHKLIVGKFFESGDTRGKIKNITITGLSLETKDGGILIVPNSFLIKNKFEVTNFVDKKA